MVIIFLYCAISGSSTDSTYIGKITTEILNEIIISNGPTPPKCISMRNVRWIILMGLPWSLIRKNHQIRSGRTIIIRCRLGSSTPWNPIFGTWSICSPLVKIYGIQSATCISRKIIMLIYQLYQDIAHLCKGENFVTHYYTQVRSLWLEIFYLEWPKFVCSEDILLFKKYFEKQRIFERLPILYLEFEPFHAQIFGQKFLSSLQRCTLSSFNCKANFSLNISLHLHYLSMASSPIRCQECILA